MYYRCYTQDFPAETCQYTCSLNVFPHFLSNLSFTPFLFSLRSDPSLFFSSSSKVANWLGRRNIMLMHGCYLLLSGATMAALTGWALVHDKTIFEFNDGAVFNLGAEESSCA